MKCYVHYASLTGALLLFGASSTFAASPSFDCAKATKADEIAICGDEQLSKNDQLTTMTFNQAKVTNRRAALATARAFLKRRAACGASVDCIADAQTRAVLDFGLLGAQLPQSETKLEKTDPTLSEIRSNCASEWQGDYSMQEYCIKRQLEALQSIKPILDNPSPIEREIFGKCADEWRKTIGFDYQMIKYCFDKQLNAYRRLN
jgi:hypothetical protein